MLHVFMNVFERAWRWLGFSPERPDAPEPPSATPIAVVEPALTVQDGPIIVDEGSFQGTGEFRFKTGVLDQLDDYMKYINRMKKADRDTYDLYRKVGIPLMPKTFAWWREDAILPASWKHSLPAFGGVAMIGHHHVEKDHPDWCPVKFMYFTKFVRKGAPLTLQPTIDADVYVCTMYYDETDKDTAGAKKKIGVVPIQYAVSVGATGAVTPLRIMRSETIRTPIKNRHRARDYQPIPRRGWGWPPYVLSWARDHNERPEEFLLTAFAYMVQTVEMHMTSMIRVTATRDGVSAVFGVDITRTPRFFEDRESVIIDGVKKRIFHIVRPHVRVTGAAVKMHFRGLRKFRWGNYDISITVPGRDHPNLRDFEAGASDFDALEPHDRMGMIGMDELGETLAAAMEPRLDKACRKADKKTPAEEQTSRAGQ